MLAAFSSLLILASLTAAVSDDRHIDAVEVYSCDFSTDVNYDRWPDDWTRLRGPKWPFYVNLGLEDDEQAINGRCLTVNLNGGSASVSSPAISVSSKFSYVLEARLLVERLQHARTRVRVDFCDESAQRNVLESYQTEWFQGTSGWTKIGIEPFSIGNEKARIARITLLVERGSHVDLDGRVSLDDVWFARLPRMTVKTNSSYNVYTNPLDVMVTCELSGILEKDPDIHFRLLDASDRRLDDESIQLQGRLINERISKASDIVNRSRPQVKGYAGSTQWRPPIRDSGFYRVEVSMRTKRGTLQRRVISLAVVPPIKEKVHGEFGWSLAGDDVPLSFEQLEELLPRVGLNWIKLPVWYGETQAERGEQLVVFAERLAAKDIEVVGIIDRPPLDLDLGKRVTEDVTIADLLSSEDPSAWLPSLDAVLTRLSLRVRWWQLGLDRDTSFSDFHNLEQEIGSLRAKLFRFGQDVRLGLGWPWHEDSSDENLATWDFQQMSATPALTGAEIATYLELPQRQGVARWAMIEPLARGEYDLETRTRDLVEQVLAAKTHGADGIFVAAPFDDRRGLMTDQGTPGDLFLPWRTTASLLSGAKFLGKIRLPGESENHIFETDSGEVLMVLWNRYPKQEVLYLGEDIRVVDVWGRSTTPERQDHRQVIEANSLPKFIVGLDASVAKWRMKSRLTEERIPSVMGIEHPNSLEITNTFSQGVGGSVELVGPPDWQVFPNKLSFKLSANERTRRPFQVILPFDANSGDAKIRADFAFNADRPYRFSVYRDVKVGDQDIELELHTHIDVDGSLIVNQRMINHSQELADFKCLLRVEGRRTQKMQVFRLGNNFDLQKYVFPDGEELIGRNIWLRAEELNGTRVLNHRVTVEQ
ncbi:MAG: hypothetical protein AAGD11_15990 [Planctomycetota bacterium]